MEPQHGRRRRTGMRTTGGRVTVLALLALVAALLVAPSAQARTDVGPDTRAFRVEATALLARYEASLAPRLDPADQARVHALIVDAGRRLPALEAAAYRLDRASAKQRPARKAAALRAHASARAAADAAFAEMQPLAIRVLGFGELLQAKSDADAMLARFDDLGNRIRGA